MDIEMFRWVLAVLGIVVVTGVYVAGSLRARSRKKALAQDLEQKHPETDNLSITTNLDGESVEPDLPSIWNDRSDPLFAPDTEIKIRPQTEEGIPMREDIAEQPCSPPEIIQIKLRSRAPSGFEGGALLRTLQSAGLEFGAMDIFHRNHSTRAEILYSVVNLVEPGTFPNGDAGGFSTPGVVLFLQVSACSQPLESFNEMLSVARVLAANLDGELLGSENRILTDKNIQIIRKSLWPVQADLYTGSRD